jgi:hypothetical protein
MFELWHRFRNKEVSRRGSKEAIEPLRRRRMRVALEAGASCGQPETAGLCRGLLKREPAQWRFAATPGLEPTNNLAERMLRPAVIGYSEFCRDSHREEPFMMLASQFVMGGQTVRRSETLIAEERLSKAVPQNWRFHDFTTNGSERRFDGPRFVPGCPRPGRQRPRGW